MRKIEIKNRFNDHIIISGKYENIKECLEKNKADLRGADLRGANLQWANLRDAYLQGADLRGANLQWANLRGANLQDAYLQWANLQDAYLQWANLRGAYLQGADLRDANLRGANLRGANLQDAYLQGADLRGADLQDAKYKEPLFLCDLYSLKLLPENTVLTFWKYLRNGLSPYQDMKYEVGKTYKFKSYNSDESQQCGEGGNVATLMWCLKDDLEANQFIEVKFKVKDIVAIPYVTDGKFRVKKLKVLRMIDREEAIQLLKGSMSTK